MNGHHPHREFVTRGCSCPRDAEGAIERAFIERTDAYGHVIARDWYLLVNPACVVHGDEAE